MRLGPISRRLGVGAAAVGLIAGLGSVPAVQGLTSAAAAPSTAINVRTFYPTFTNLGTVNFSQLSAAAEARTRGASAAAAAGWRAVDNHAATYEVKRPSTVPVAANTTVTTKNVRGESGFVGMTGYDQAVANGGVDLEPPDQGLCAGQGVVGEFINNSFTVYQPDGSHLLGVIPSYALFKQPSTAFLSDPRCHYDGPTQRWFLTEFIVGAPAPSLQFIAVSNTSDPTGVYTVWAINTTDKGTTGCPCFGDYDELGMDNNGVYITTDEFPVGPGGYNGVVMYAISKSLLETFATTGIAPVPIAYRLTHDPFGQPYIVSPTSTPPKAKFAINTEYFVESNGNAFQDDHLIVYALGQTSLLASPGPAASAPPLPGAGQVGALFLPARRQADAGDHPARQVGPGSARPAAGRLRRGNADHLRQRPRVRRARYRDLKWQQRRRLVRAHAAPQRRHPHRHGGHQGYVAVTGASLIYPAIGIDKNGLGYMVFALSGTSNHPSAAYVAFGPSGASGPVRIAMAGANPEDSFTCYAAFVGPNYGGCRWGDYSAAVAMGGKIYMATEMIPPTSRDYLTNWGTFVWSAPPPPSS